MGLFKRIKENWKTNKGKYANTAVNYGKKALYKTGEALYATGVGLAQSNKKGNKKSGFQPNINFGNFQPPKIRF